MAQFRPALPFSTPLVLLKPSYLTIQGVRKPAYPEVSEGDLIYGSFKSYGGTEAVVNGILSIVDTAEVSTWFRPDIKSDCIIVIAETNERYEILNEPEDIDKRHQFLKFKVKRIKGGV